MSGTPIPSIGRIVLYRLTKSDVDKIQERWRSQFIKGGFEYNPVFEGATHPMIIVHIFGNEPDIDSWVNGQVFLDGNDTHWACTQLGIGPGTFSWPTKG